MPNVRRHTRRLVTLTAASVLALAAVLVPASAQAATPTHTIADIQGTGDATPVNGASVIVEGVVTADYRTGGYRGIYVQTAGSGGTTDATPGASDGIFVYLGSQTTPAVIGDLVQVAGTAGEYFGLTQVSASAAGTSVTVVSSGAALPAPVPLPDTVVGADREQYEGMLVDPQGSYVVSSTHEVDRYGTVWLATGTTLPVKSTELARPGTAADEIAAENDDRTLLLDDGKNNQVTGATQPYLTAGDPVRVGDGVELGDLTYVLHYGFNRWRLQPTTPIDATTPADAKASFPEANPRPASPVDVGGDLKVAAFNVLNYFTTFSNDDADARGARNATQFAIQRAKIVAAINALGADVVALQEIENSVHFAESVPDAADGTPDVALADLVAGLNDAAGSAEWAYVPTPAALVGAGAPDTDVIMNAIIYRTAAVTPLGDSVADVDETVWDIAREPIAQAFTPVDGDPFVVVANHFKSKSAPDVTPVPAEPADGQGYFNAERVEQAQALADFVTELQTATGTDDVAILGDLNSYAMEDPIALLTDAGFVDLVPTLAAGQYTYTFDGEQGSLDHALATPSFAERVAGADVWDINADEWFGYQYYGSFPEVGTVYRSSDHDPVVLGVNAAAGDGTVTIDLLGINDFHGRIEASGASAGAAVLAGAVDSYRDANPNTLFVSAGDNIGASTFTSFVQDDVPTIESLNAAGLDASSFGNHEFDQGRDDIDNRVLGLADFPYLAANLYDRATGEPAYDPYWITELDGVTIGFIGAVTEGLPSLVTPAGIATLETRPIVPEVNRFADQLSDGDDANGEADVLVLLVHEGPAHSDSVEADPVFGALLSQISGEVDGIFSGHTHQKFAYLQPVAGWADGLARPVVQSGQYGENLAHVQLQVDAATGDVVANSAEIVPLAGAGFTPDPEVTAIVADAVAVANVQGQVSLGQITDDLMRARQANPATENRGGESTLGNLVADVQLWATQDIGAQIAFMNPGGLRTDILYASTGTDDPDGNVTYREAANVQPFANTLVAMTLTGEQIVQVLEEQWQPVVPGGRPFLKLGTAGLTYTYDPTAASGDRITQVLVGDTPLDLAGSYRVVVNSFLASGGDNFTTLGQGTDKADSGRVDLQAFVDYFAEFSPLSPDLTQRAVGVHLTTPVPEAGFLPGDMVSADLSSLLFSAGEDQGAAPTVVVSIGGAEVASAAIDPSVVDTTDEVGRAAVSFAVPVDAPGGDLEVVLTVPSTGTTTSFTIPVQEIAGPACTVDYQAVRLLGRTMLGAVTVANTGTDPVENWQLTWQYTNGERAMFGLGATVRQRGTAVTAIGWFGADLDPAESASFAFVGRAPRGIGTPTGFALNGVECAVE
jgi:5'-nucleotidase